MKHILPFIFSLSILLTACSQATPPASMIETAIAQTQVASIPTEIPTIPTATQDPFEITMQAGRTINAANAQTRAAIPTITPKSTNTPKPTATKRPTPIPTAMQSLEGIRQEFIDLIIRFLSEGETLEDIERVNLVRLNEDGTVEIEVILKWASKDRQPPVSYAIIQFLAAAFGKWDVDTIQKLAYGHDMLFNITTFAADMDYRYFSSTTFDTLKLVDAHQISYDEWVAQAQAGFK